MEYYILRIYRNEKDSPEKLVGTIEPASGGEKKSFRRAEELWEALVERKARCKKGKADWGKRE